MLARLWTSLVDALATWFAPKAEASVASTIHYFHTDHLGSTNVVTDSTGTQVKLNEYTPFGSVVIQQGTASVSHTFTGQFQDEGSGLLLFPARAYDPQLGRFIQADSIVQAPSDPQSLNRYSYVRNNPLILVDPSGHSWLKQFFNKWVSPLAFGIASTVAGINPALATLLGGTSIVQVRQAMETGNWKPVLTGMASAAMGVALNFIIPGSGLVFSNFAIQMAFHIARGALIGALVGGIGAELGGGSFGRGAALGAITGAIGGAVQGLLTSQQFTNLTGGYGFRSNHGVIRSLRSQGQYQEAIDYNINRNGITSAQGAKYDPALVGRGNTSTKYGIRIGKEAFENPHGFGYGFGKEYDSSSLTSAIYHEGLHAQDIATGRVPANAVSPGAGQNTYEATIYGRTLAHANELDLSPNMRGYNRAQYEAMSAAGDR